MQSVSLWLNIVSSSSQQIDVSRSLSAGEKGRDTVLDRDESFLWNHFMLKEMLLFRSHMEEQDRDQMDAGGLLVSSSSSRSSLHHQIHTGRIGNED